IIQITLLLLVPFILGQILRPWIYPKMMKMPKIVKVFDQGSILLVVYGAFSSAVVAGLWNEVSLSTLLKLLLASSVLLTLVLLLSQCIPRWLGFSRANQNMVCF